MSAVSIMSKGKHAPRGLLTSPRGRHAVNGRVRDSDDKDPIWGKPGNPFPLDEKLESPRSERRKHAIPRAGAAAMLAVAATLSPSSANTGLSYPTEETVVTAPANVHEAAQLNLDGMVADMLTAEHQANHPAEASPPQPQQDDQAPNP